jgi:S1-C subfamily serine protease
MRNASSSEAILLNVGGIKNQAGAVCAAVVVALALMSGPNALAQAPEDDIELVNLEQHVRRVATIAAASVVTVVSVHSFPTFDIDGNVSSTRDQGDLEATVGSGIVINRNGDVITTTSVIGAGIKYQITSASGDIWDAELVGYDRESRLCLLRSGARNLQPIRMGRSEKIGPGTMLIIVGRAYGNLPTVSFGAMSERHPWKDELGTELISMSAPVYPGNNGGAVLNFRGELIGVVSGTLGGFESDEGESLAVVPSGLSEIVSPTQDAQVSFAIPVETLGGALPKLRSGNARRRAYFGVSIASAEGAQTRDGVTLSDVVPKSPAAGAGLRGGDVIFKYNGIDVTSAEELKAMVRRSEMGSTVEIIFYRDGALNTTLVVLNEISPN